MPVTAFTATIVGVALSIPVAAVALIAGPHRPSDLPPVETIAFSGGRVDFPEPGEYVRDGHPVAAPASDTNVAPFSIMTYQVSRDDYGRCVVAGACDTARGSSGPGDAPVTGVSFLDASAYAEWYARTTGETWRLPTAAETAAAAAERFADEESVGSSDPANPALAWIRAYRAEAAAKRPADPVPKPRGHYGANSLGLADFAGNVWEWTSTCYVRVALDADGKPGHAIENCGVRVVEGRHRSYMTDFIRDPASGGCAVGTPPENLGFRLVRESPAPSIAAWIAGLLVSAPRART